MIYILNFDPSQLEDPKIFHQYITHLKGITDWWHYLPSTYLLYSPYKYMDHINAGIRQSYPDLRFLLTILNISDYRGLLHKDAWDWLNKYKGIRIVKPPTIKFGLPPIGSLNAPLRSKTTSEILRRGK